MHAHTCARDPFDHISVSGSGHLVHIFNNASTRQPASTPSKAETTQVNPKVCKSPKPSFKPTTEISKPHPSTPPKNSIKSGLLAEEENQADWRNI